MREVGKTVKPRKNAKRSPEKKAEQIKQILDLMNSGLSLHKACQSINLSMGRFNDWVSQDTELAADYARARENLIEKMAAETMEISDEELPTDAFGKVDSAAVQKQRLRVDTRKWLLSKLAPKKYGEKLHTELTGADGGDLKLSATVETYIVKLPKNGRD